MNLVRIIKRGAYEKYNINDDFVLFVLFMCSGDSITAKCFPLNGTDSEDIMSGQTADIHGAVHALADRFGTNGKAISFDKEDSYLSFPLVTSGEQGQRELTLTYWLYVSQDSISQAFWTKIKMEICCLE